MIHHLTEKMDSKRSECAPCCLYAFIAMSNVWLPVSFGKPGLLISHWHCQCHPQVMASVWIYLVYTLHVAVQGWPQAGWQSIVQYRALWVRLQVQIDSALVESNVW